MCMCVRVKVRRESGPVPRDETRRTMSPVVAPGTVNVREVRGGGQCPVPP